MAGLGGVGENGGEIDAEVANPQNPLLQQQENEEGNRQRLTLAQKWRLCLEYAVMKGRGVQHMTAAKMQDLCEIVGRAPTTIKRIWKEYNDQSYFPFNEDIDLEPKFKGRCGVARRLDAAEIEVVIKGVIDEAGGYITYRMIEKRMHDIGFQVCASTIRNYCLRLNMQEVSNFIRPLLTEENRMKRLFWVLSFIYSNDNDGTLWFDEMYDYVYIDEKWFRLEQVKRKLKRFADSPPEPHRHMQSKSHPTQVMHSVGVGRPRFSQVSNSYFTGLLTIMAHIQYEEALRNSCNRPAGTMVPTPYTINAENFNEAMTMDDGLIEAIEEGIRPHVGDDFVVNIQLDNAPGHTGHNNMERLAEHVQEQGYNIQFVLQPSNSPDLNLCDLTFFRSLDAQVNYLKDGCHGIVELMEAVEAGFEAYDHTKLEHGFGHLFATFRKVLEHRGGNDFRSPHDHVRENIAGGLPLNFVGMNIPQVNELVDIVNNYFVDDQDNYPPLGHL